MYAVKRNCAITSRHARQIIATESFTDLKNFILSNERVSGTTATADKINGKAANV